MCQLNFEREQGYFLGAMYISYGLGPDRNRRARRVRLACHPQAGREAGSSRNPAVLAVSPLHNSLFSRAVDILRPGD